MNVLLDSCTFIWLCSSPASLSPAATRVIEEAETQLWLSIASAWEISLKVRSGKIVLPEKLWSWMTGRLAYWQIELLDVNLEAVCRSSELPDIHKDPFDRLLVAQSIIHQLAILTPDPLVQRHPAKTVW